MVENIFILDRQKQVIKMLTLNGQRAFFDDLYTQELSTGTETFEFSTNTSDDIIEGYYVMFKYNEDYKLFQIIEIQQEHDEGNIILTCYCEGACLELLNKIVKSFSKDMTPQAFLEYVLFDTTWEIGNIDPLLDNNVQTVTLDKPASIWKTIQNYANVFGYEIDTRVIYENKHVKKCYIDLYSEGERGNYLSAKRFEYGRNVNGIVKKKDLYEWCTAMVIANATSGILDVHFNENGYNKGIGSDTITANIQNELYNNGNDYIYGVYDGDGDSAQEIVSAALKELQRRSIPRYDYEVTTALTYNEYSNLHIGDTVRVIDHTFIPSLLLEARVSKLELSFSDRTKCSCTLSNYKEMTTKIAKAKVEQVDDYTIIFTKEAIVIKTDLDGNLIE